LSGDDGSKKNLSFFLMPINIFKSMHETFEKMVGPNVTPMLLYECGFNSGVDTATKLNFPPITMVEGDAERISNLGLQIGLGIIKVNKMSPEELLLDVMDSNEAIAMGQRGKCVCDLTRGYVAGLLSVLMSKDMKAVETDCMSKGSEACHFRVVPRPKKGKYDI